MKPTKNSLFPYYEKIDLSEREEYRVYVFPNGEKVQIDKPTFLIVSDNGHRVGQGEFSHYVPYGWIHLYWKNKIGHNVNFYCQEKKEKVNES